MGPDYRRLKSAIYGSLVTDLLAIETLNPIIRPACKYAVNYVLQFDGPADHSALVPRPVFHQ